MRGELLEILDQKIAEIKKLEEDKQKEEREVERFVEERVIPEALEILKPLESFLSARGIRVELRHGKKWITFRLIHRDGDWNGLKITRTEKGFELQGWFCSQGREYTASSGECITPETWDQEKFEERVFQEVEEFLWRAERKGGL